MNDTRSLPESGRVCVAGFGPTAAATGHFSLTIDSAHADVQPMSEPRNPGQVLGVGATIQSVRGPVFAAYFAASRERFDAEPNYRNGLFVLVDRAVYAVREEGIATTLRRGFSTREFSVLRAGRVQQSIEYEWPWYREPFAQARPGQVKSEDFLRELSAMIEAYR